MLKLFALCAISAFGVAALAAAAESSQDQPPQQPPPPPQFSANLKAGDVAPDFALPGSDGKVHKLSDYRGKTVVLAWFPKAFTGG